MMRAAPADAPRPPDMLAGQTILFAGIAACGHGGIQRFNRRVADTLAALGADRRLLFLADDPSALAALGGGGQVVGAGGSRWRLFAALPRLARDSDVLLLGHINLLPLALAYRLLRPRGRVILFAHGIEVWGDPRFRRVRRPEPALLRRVIDRVATVSRHTETRMAEAFRLPANRFRHFPNAVSLLPAPPPRRERGHNILAVSRLGAGEREKHVDKLIRAMPRVIDAHPDATLTIIGDGALRDELAALAAALGVGDRVTFAGAVGDAALARAYDGAALFALPSSKEGFGIVYLEAWLRALPVIASCYGAGGEVVNDGQDGFVIDPDDVPTLADRLIRLLGDPALAARLGTAGRAKVERLYSDQAFTANLHALCAGDAR